MVSISLRTPAEKRPFVSVDPSESGAVPQNESSSASSAEDHSGTKVRFVIYMTISYCTMQLCVYFFDKLLGLYSNLSAEMSANVAAWMAIVLVSLSNFFWLMHYVYRTAHGHRWWQFWKYLQSIIGFRLWEAVVFYLICKLLGGDDPSWLDLLAAVTIMQGQSIVMKFIVYKKLIFRAKPSAEHDEELAVHAAPPDFTDD